LKVSIKKRGFMKILASLILLALCCGCQERKGFELKCTTEKIDGVVTSVKVTIPNNRSSEQANFYISSREDMDKLISSLESLLNDLKQTREQMPIIEQQKQEK